MRPYLRGAPPGLPFELDASTLKVGLNFILTTSAGDLDLLGELSLGAFEQVAALSSPLVLYGHDILVLDLSGLERTKKAAGRIKDLADIAFIAELKKRQPEG